ncbi:MAG: YjgN family protein [Pseudomonadota bacterium]
MVDNTHSLGTPVPPQAIPFPMSFQGNGFEYFKIASVNLALTLLTLGLYSPWAKVRTRQYFYGNTLLDSAAFRYTAKPVTILKGRLIAVAALVVYLLAQRFFPVTVAPIAFVLALIAPWAIMRSLAFNYANTEYRGLRFHLAPDVKRAYWVYGPPSLAIAALVASGSLFSPQPDVESVYPYMAVSFGGPLIYFALYPWFVARGTQFAADHARYGDASFNLSATARHFYGYYVGNALLYLLAVAVMVGLFWGAAVVLGDEARVSFWPTLPLSLSSLPAVLMLAIGVAISACVMAFFKARGFNLVYNNLHMRGGVRLNANADVWRLARINIINYFSILLTLGIAYPWARVRTTRYLASTFALIGATSLDGYVARARQDDSATGEEIGEVFDLGIGL